MEHLSHERQEHKVDKILYASTDEKSQPVFKTNQKYTNKSKNKAPAELPNNVPFNPYKATDILHKGQNKRRLPARDPRFSDFSGVMDLDAFRKSYKFLDEMRKDETKKIKNAIMLHEKYPETAAKANNALKMLSHLNIASIQDAKRMLNKYEAENVQLEKTEEIKALKRKLISEEKERIASTGKIPYYFPDKKVKKMYKEIQKKKIKEAVASASINHGPARAIHKKLAAKSRRKLPKERKSNIIPTHRTEHAQ
ncbi:hypothetical protein BEWA_011130 [Theileria equi strain WA]|uniref:rRNA biogenesis protein RRP36 n=1 Tax=Theileria equi strain WA TaxID=1537102 RepID=L0B1I9_THEEQ|nr:hypothetical protein BEWA_011130 [Theileria equi strain WA]AFZ81695.1 hypothetical protein BEWA_011130 [Theileria equi strain WA]|eukprot:XP_004831361.1 hypothetical protein BEWA_011130 [Theileria equi strain WA]